MIADSDIIAHLRGKGLAGRITAGFVTEYRQHLGVTAVCSALARDPQLRDDFNAICEGDITGDTVEAVQARIVAAGRLELQRELAA